VARGTQLLQLVTMLRDEIGQANSVAVGSDATPGLQQKLRRVQDTLYIEHDWPFLRQHFNRIALQAGQRFYDVPNELNTERIEEVAVWFNALPLPIEKGIGWEEYAKYESEADSRAEPALRWDIRWTGSKEQIEIWPIPSTNDQELQIRGIRKLRPLIANSDVCDIDDQLIVMFAAAELLARAKSPDAQAMLSLAQRRLGKLQGLNARGGVTQNMAQGRTPERPRTVVRVS
jgi:hypothetical protein